MKSKQPMRQAEKKGRSTGNLPPGYDPYDDAELWESGKLGATEKYVRVVSAAESRRIDKAIGIESVVVRMPKGLGDELRKLAKKEKMDYMPFIRKVLDRYVCRMLSSKVKQRNHKTCG